MPENPGKIKSGQHLPRTQKQHLWGWRLAFVSFLLICLFYACHPLIFSPEPVIGYDGDEEVVDGNNFSGEKAKLSGGRDKKSLSEENRLTSAEFRLAEACLNEDLSNCYNYSYPEGFIGTENGISTSDDIAFLLDALSMNEISDEESYRLYEEDLPENIIEDDAGKSGKYVHYNHKDIKSINISLQHKPAYWGETPLIAVVIDDMGVNVGRSSDIIKLKAPLTSSFLTYGPQLSRQIAAAQNAGHEIMAHVPMEPHRDLYTAPDGLKVNMEDDELKRNFEIMLKKFPGVRGVNNHMGSKFTENEQKMSDIMEVLAAHKLFFLDSKTTPKSVGEKTARKHGVEYAHRHVFLDNKNDKKYILNQLAQTERIARKNGYAVAIGHPKSQTYEALKEWLPTLEQKKLKLVHMSRIVDGLN